ncbi:MAG: MOSC domain-containing protein [Solirubrobacteraceae bacterium]
MSSPSPPTVTALSVTPIKSTRLQPVQAIELDELGARGNRRFFIIDERDRMINGKRLGTLQTVVAELDGAGLQLSFADGTSVQAPVDLGEEITARFFSGDVTGRVVDGPFSEALSSQLGRPLRLVEATGSVDRGRLGGVSVISVASLRRLAEQANEESVDGRRFRMLIEVDGVAPHAEDSWVGRSARVGSAVVRFRGHVGRCLTTSRDPETGRVDLPTLDLLDDYRRQADTTEPLPFGIYGEVTTPGRVSLGDAVSLI